MEQEIVYFELNNWFAGRDYPYAEPFITWLKDDLQQSFLDREWVNDNKLCVVFSQIDMSYNYCITATKDWILEHCPDLISDKEYDTTVLCRDKNGIKRIVEHYSFHQFLRFPDENGNVYGKFGTTFLEYKEENFGIFFNKYLERISHPLNDSVG